ncbi:Sn-glycerol-3-phosphate transport system permease protein UgpA [Maritalea myrionectae]|uniref:Sn-glycerol-3-phosphate transport system permease protein UgpA n=1 Tax=Maritalea myrionectae TaxID=454601 RepID=A0A2R4MG38_9HYPH|nr:sugar ABC transporter permease [Maritalea myrionectae]AVX04925.1 Sn-glycerol-3-phosphate transport system permease protein UgpA [Maritalea myrionectae]
MSKNQKLSAEEHRILKRRFKRRQNLIAFAFLAPNLVFFAGFLLIPIVVLFWQTFHSGGVMSPMKFVGLENWHRTFIDPLVLKSIKNTIVYSFIAIPVVFVLAMVVALSMRVAKFGQNLFKSIIYFPTLQPMLVAALMWTFVLHPDFGALNLLIRVFTGTPINFLGDPNLALPTIAMVEVWKGLGFWALLFFAGLTSLPTELFQAAELDGAGPFRRFWQHALPLMKPTFFFSVIFATIVNLQLFDSVFVLTDGGPVNSTATATWYVYRSLFTFNEPGFGATLAFVLVIVVLVLTAIQMTLLKEGH